MENLCIRAKNIFSYTQILMKLTNKVSFRVLFFIFLLNYDVFAYPNNRPTQEAINADIANCSPMWASLGACFIGYQAGYGIVSCATAFTAYGVSRSIQEDLADGFKNNSKVVNHQDINNDGLNDFAMKKEQSCSDLVGQTIPKVMVDSAGEVHRISADGDYTNSSGDASLPPSLSFLVREYTKELVLRLPGCQRNKSGEVIGETYELFDPDKYIDNNDPSKPCTGVRVSYGGDEECILRDDCKIMGAYVVCAYEVDDMICAEGVFCSMNIIGMEYDGGSEFLSFVSNTIDLSNIEARVDNGVDGYSDDSNTEMMSCADVCTLDGDFKIDYEGFDNEGEMLSKDKGDSGCFTKLQCSKCYDLSECVDEKSAQRIEDCDPTTDDDNAQVCGYIYNPKYLAHCVPKQRTAYEGDYVFPKVISPHCTGDAVIRDRKGNEISSFAGKAMRCIDQTIKNIFYGTYNIVGNYTNPVNNMVLSQQVTGIACISDDSQVANASECDNGVFVKFQNFSKNIVSTMLVLAMFLIGLLILFGMFDSIKMAFKYIVVLAIVLYFVHGNAWRDGFLDFLMEGGTEIGSIVFNSLDFGEVDTSDSAYSGVHVSIPDDKKCIPIDDYGPGHIVYPEFNLSGDTVSFEHKYMVWDMYDCRAGNFFGWGDIGGAFLSFLGNSLFSLISFILLGIIIGPITILMFMFVMLKSLFLMVSTMIVITLLVLVSPLVIPLVLFTNQKARGVFDNWLKQLLGYSMVPIILFIVLGIFFKVLDNSIYGSNLGDVFTVNADGETVISDECREVFMPCFIHKMQTGMYDGNNTIIGIPIPWIGMEGIQAFMIAALRLFFVFIVMLMVFSFITKALIAGLLEVSVMEDNVVEAMKKGLQTSFSLAASGVHKLGSGIAKMGEQAATGDNDNDYGTK